MGRCGKTESVLRGCWQLQAVVRERANGPVIAVEAAAEKDLADHRSELWLQACARKGHPEVRADDLEVTVLPSFRQAGSAVLSSFQLRSGGKDGVAVTFFPASLAPVACRAVRRLLDLGRLSRNDTVHYEIHAQATLTQRAGAAAAEAVELLEPTRPSYLRCPMEPLLGQARPVGEVRRCDYPLFYAAEALAGASMHCRAGWDCDPPVETGALLLGVLCSCPRSGEFFGVVCQAVPIEAAAETRFSLTLSAESWQRMQAAVKAERERTGIEAIRLLGAAHGHPFVPGAESDRQTRVSRDLGHTAYVSSDDIEWARAVFSQEPCQLSHIFGRNGDGQCMHRLFGQRNGTLQARGFYVVPSAAMHSCLSGE